MRKQKKPTAAEAIKRMEIAEQRYVLLRLKVEDIQAALLETMFVYEKIMETLLETAGTIHEARRWYSDYREAVHSVNPDSETHKEDLIKALNDKGFIITFDEIPDFKEELYNQWEKDRERKAS